MTENLHNIIALLEAHWNGKHILVVGDVMLDKYIHGVVERISPEAPVPVVRALHRSQSPGGAANVAMNIVGLKGQATLVGFTGTDDDDTQLRQALCQTQLTVELISVPGMATTSKLRILGGSQQMIRLDVESAAPRLLDFHVELLRRVEEAMPFVDGVILSDYAKGALTEDVCRTVVDNARGHGLPVFVDPKNRDFSRYRGATAICPNLKELTLAVGKSATDIEALMDEGQKLVKQLALEYMIVTMGEKGITILHEKERTHLPSVAKQVFDVSGAGDTVIATISLAVLCGISIKDAAQLANVAAGIVVSKQGTVPLAHHELVAALTESSFTRVEEKLLGLERLVDRCGEWRSAGDKIVFTSGCFETLNIGHITLLESCRAFGTRVVVGISSDASVEKLKGLGYPLIGEADRAKILAALASTDAVVIFDQMAYTNIIAAVCPDVIVEAASGEDGDTMPAAMPAAPSSGGKVEMMRIVCRSV